MPQGFDAGQWGVVQLVRSDAYQVMLDGRSQRLPSNGMGFMLDKNFPLHRKQFSTSETPLKPIVDLPQFDLNRVAWVQADVGYQSFLMFMPPGDGSIWIPLQKFDWGFGGGDYALVRPKPTIVYDQYTYPTGPAAANGDVTAVGAPTTTFPAWNKNIVNFSNWI
jgi:hypothetical protein